jgi:hypothetical protein
VNYTIKEKFLKKVKAKHPFFHITRPQLKEESRDRNCFHLEDRADRLEESETELSGNEDTDLEETWYCDGIYEALEQSREHALSPFHEKLLERHLLECRKCHELYVMELILQKAVPELDPAWVWF